MSGHVSDEQFNKHDGCPMEQLLAVMSQANRTAYGSQHFIPGSKEQAWFQNLVYSYSILDKQANQVVQ